MFLQNPKNSYITTCPSIFRGLFRNFIHTVSVKSISPPRCKIDIRMNFLNGEMKGHGEVKKFLKVPSHPSRFFHNVNRINITN